MEVVSHCWVAQNYIAASAIILSVSSDSVCSQFTWILLYWSWTNITMAALDRNLPAKCTKCNHIVVKKNMARHKQSCDNGTLSCPKSPNFYAKKKEDLNYHLAKHHARRILNLVKCVPYFGRIFLLASLFNNTRGESMELQQKLEQNRVKSSEKF